MALTIVFSFIFKNPWLFAFLAFGAFFAGKMAVAKLRTDFAAEFIEDIISYREPAAQRLILERVYERLSSIVDPGQKIKVNFIGHSLGTVIASDSI